MPLFVDPAEQRGEVLHVLGDDAPIMLGRPPKQLCISEGPKLVLLGDGEQVVAAVTQRGSDHGGMHLVEQQRQAHASSRRSTRHARSASLDARSASSISASTSSG